MQTRRILLVDSDSKNIRILQESFAEKQYKMDHAATDKEAYQKAEQHPYDVVISEITPPDIDGHRLLEKLQRNPNTASVPLIFLTKKSDLWNRVRSFRLGAKDFIVKPIHVMEIIARVGMVISRLEKRHEEEAVAKKKFVGRLEDLCIADLIETLGVERKTGVLTVNNENGLNGHIFFKNGAVINANTNGLQAEEAIYKMMGWAKGRFSMLFKDVSIADEVSISNLGLLIQGSKRMQDRDEILSQLPPIDSVLITSSNFRKIIGPKKLTPDLDYFLNLFDGERTLARIIDESSYDDLTTLERVLKLYRLGFLNVLRDKARERKITEPDIDMVKKATKEPAKVEQPLDKSSQIPIPILKQKAWEPEIETKFRPEPPIKEIVQDSSITLPEEVLLPEDDGIYPEEQELDFSGPFFKPTTDAVRLTEAESITEPTLPSETTRLEQVLPEEEVEPTFPEIGELEQDLDFEPILADESSLFDEFEPIESLRPDVPDRSEAEVVADYETAPIDETSAPEPIFREPVVRAEQVRPIATEVEPQIPAGLPH